MDDPRWLRLVVVGLVLAVLVVIYLLFSGAFVKSKTVTKTAQTQNQKVVVSPQPISDPNAFPSVVNNQSTPSAYEKIVDKSQGNVTTLPKTGLPLALGVIFSFSAIVSGWSLRKFPS